MNITITPGKLRGTIRAIPSKSHAHRAMICAALADAPTELLCWETSLDLDATARCLNALGASITRTESGFHIIPIGILPKSAKLYCGESGSTLRFLLPLVGVLGVDAIFVLEGRLPQRPLSPFGKKWNGWAAVFPAPHTETIQCQGRLKPGSYHIPGNISSQYISGLLLSLIHADGDSEICISGTLESRPYVDLTFYTLDQFNTTVTAERIPGNQRLRSPGILPIEGDWSNAAFFLAASSLGSDIAVKGLPHTSFQGDQAIQSLLPCFRETPQISAANIPDLIPILSVVAAANRGAIFTDIQRLRTKESDRVEAIIQMLRSLGGNGEIADNTLTIFGTGLTGGMVDSCNDHRIAMSAAIAATVCTKPVTILGAQCVRKSYPLFWEEYSHLGGHYEQYIR